MKFPSFAIASKTFVNSDQIEQYRDCCERTAWMVTQTGRSVRPYMDPELTRFRNHPDAALILKSLKAYCETLEEMSAAGDSLKDDKRILWRMINKMGFCPQSDLLEKIEDGDTVEIYTTDNLQIFRNLVFFDYLHVTIDEICTFVWTRDSKRSASISSEGLRLMFLMKTGLMRATHQVSTMPAHLVRTRLAGLTQTVRIAVKTISPLVEGRQTVAFVITNKSQKIS